MSTAISDPESAGQAVTVRRKEVRTFSFQPTAATRRLVVAAERILHPLDRSAILNQVCETGIPLLIERFGQARQKELAGLLQEFQHRHHADKHPKTNPRLSAAEMAKSLLFKAKGKPSPCASPK